MNITLIYDSRNFTIIRDDITKYIWLYSHQKPIAYYDNGKVYICKNLDNRHLTHVGVFKKKLKNNEL